MINRLPGILLHVFLIICLSASAYAQVSSSPNIILIYADDLGFGETGVYGQTKIKTPYIDRMAAEGMRLTNFYTGSPVCAPARCILLTGRHSGHSYIRGNYELGGFDDAHEGGQMPLPEGTFTIAHMLKSRGYSTGAIGKWGLGVYGSSGSPEKMGFEYFYGYLDQKQAHNHYPTHLWENGKWDSLNNREIYVHHPLEKSVSVPDSFQQFRGMEYAEEKMLVRTRSFIQQNKRKQFFLYLPFTLPHLSLQAPDSWVNKYKGSFNEQPYRGENGYASTLYPLSTYAAMISYLDSMVGAVFTYLEEAGLMKNTIVLFTSDNGATFNTGGFDREFFGSNLPLRGGKQDLYEGGIRVPFVAWWPGKILPGTVSGAMAWQPDLMATLAELSGALPTKSDGRSMLPILLKQKNNVGQPVFYFEFPEKGGQLAVRINNWKGIKKNLKSNPAAPWELYNLEVDISESSDQAFAHPEIIKEMDAIVKKSHQHSHIREWEFVDPKF